MIKLSATKMEKALIDCLKANVVPFISGSPGTGKSSLVKAVADKCNLVLIDVRLSQMEPSDISGLPWFNNGKAEFQPFNVFPLKDTPIPEGKEGFLLFLDELNSAQKQVQAAAYRLVLDRQVGNHDLHPNTLIVCAGNLSTDNAIVNRMGTAMQSRLVHLFMDVNSKDWLEEIAVPNNYHEVIISFINMYPDKLFVFDPDTDEYTFACPRTWEFVDRLIKAHDGMDDSILPIIAGAISEGIARELLQFSKVFENLPTIEDIIKDPKGIKIDFDTATKWALTVHLVQRVKEENIEPLMEFMDRQDFDGSFKTIFFRSIHKKHPNWIMKYPKMMKVLSNLASDIFN